VISPSNHSLVDDIHISPVPMGVSQTDDGSRWPYFGHSSCARAALAWLMYRCTVVLSSLVVTVQSYSTSLQDAGDDLQQILIQLGQQQQLSSTKRTLYNYYVRHDGSVGSAAAWLSQL
jgi:hypothetical protein